MPPKTRKPLPAAEQAEDDRPALARFTELPPYPHRSDTHAPSDNPRAPRLGKRPRTSTAASVDGNRSSLAVEPRAHDALGQIEESLGVLKEELQSQKQESGQLKSDLSHAREQNIALEEELRNLRDKERLQRLDSTAKIDDLSLQLTKQKAKAASELSIAYQEVNDRFGSSPKRVDVATQMSKVSFVYGKGGRKTVWDE